MQKTRLILFLFFFLLLIVKSNAQDVSTLYFLNDIPQATLLNPAFSPIEDNFVIGLPFISGFNVGFNNEFKFESATERGYGILNDTLRFNFNSLYDVIGEKGKVNLEANVSMLFVGIKSNRRYYSLSVNEKAFFRGSFSKEFIEYFVQGSKPYYGSNSDIGNLNFNITQYREFSFGISELSENKKFTYGARLKLLFGRMNMSSKQMDFRLETSPDVDSLYLIPSGSVEISGPVRFETDTVEKSTRLRADLHASDYFFNFRNLGLATDIGFDYKVNNQLNVSASITDIGFIRFSKKNFLLNATFPIEYHRDSLTQATNPGSPDYFPGNNAIYAFRDSIPFMTTAETSEKSQIAALPIKFYIGANYKANRDLTLGLLQKLYFQKRFFNFVSTISAQTFLSNNFSLTGSLSVMKNSYFNLGLGGNYKSKAIQVYFATDNIFSLVAPSSVKNLNLQLGVNLFIDNE